MAVQISGNDITVPRDTTVTRNLTVGGVLTYEDVTNVDSVGLITARSGVKVTSGDITMDTAGNITLGDSGASTDDRLVFGAGSDLSIYHDGSHSYITNTTGDLRITDTSGMLIRSNSLDLRNGAGDENYISCAANGSVSLYYDNSKKLETSSTGVTVTGTVTADGLVLSDSDEIQFGNSTDFRIYHDSSNSYIRDVGTGNLIIAGSAVNILNGAASESMIRCTENGAVQLYYDNDEKLATGSVGLYAKSIMPSTHATYDIGQNMGRWNDIYIADNGKLKIGQDNDLQLYHDGSHSYVSDASTGNLKIISNGTAVQIEKSDGENMAVFRTDGAVELYNDNSKKFETSSTGIKVTSEESRIVMFDESNGVNERKVFYSGLGNTATGTFTASNCHGGGTVTVVGMNNGNGNISTTKMYPIHINSSGTATLGSIIFEINGSTSASSFTVSAAAQGISVTNGGGAFCQFRVTFDITANVS